VISSCSSVDGKTMFKWIVKKWSVGVWNGFIWSRKGSGGGLL
jgi:hypothetical protein